LRDGHEELTKLNVVVLGVSFDSVEDNRAFAEKNAFPFRLLSDTDRKMGVAYGAADDSRQRTARRMSFILDEQGRVAHVYPKVSPKTHLDVVLKDLRRSGQSTAP
jgi:peroxiredoxin Q/BCP